MYSMITYVLKQCAQNHGKKNIGLFQVASTFTTDFFSVSWGSFLKKVLRWIRQVSDAEPSLTVPSRG